MTIYFIDTCLNCENRIILEKKITTPETTLNKVVYINSEKLNITQFVSTALRCSGKVESQRMMILPVDFQRQAIQLSIANQNKQMYQVYEATTAKVFDVWRYMFCDDESNSKENSNKDLCDLVAAHRSTLQAAGLFDHFNLSDMLKKDMLCKGPIYEKLSCMTLIIEDVERFSAIDLRLLAIVLEHSECKKVITVNANRSLDISGIGELLEDAPVVQSPEISFDVTDCPANEFIPNLNKDSIIFRAKENETCKRRIEQIFVSHIRLLINTKDEFALALILNLPGRDITPQIFSAIKNAAAAKNMPIYQAIMSTVMRHRLGGKGYQPVKGCPIHQNLKPLTNLVDFMMKLQDLIEEDKEPQKCALMILAKIKTALKTVCGSLMKAHQMEHAFNVITDDLKQMMETDRTSLWGEINEEENASCALQTLKTNSGYNDAMKALQHLCDAEAGKNTHFYVNNYDFNSTCPQKTPSSHLKGSPQVELPSLVHLYKSPSSPAVVKGDKFEEDSTPLLSRLQNIKTPTHQLGKAALSKRMRSHLDWVGEDVSPASNKSPATPGVFSPIVGPTLKAVGCQSKKISTPERDWKETLDEVNQNIAAREVIDEELPTNKRKRALIKDISNLPPEETKTKKSAPPSRKEAQEPKTKRRKTSKDVKQIKGQQSLMKFFS